MREELGVMVSFKANLISPSTGQQGAIEGDFGVNTIPTREAVIAMVENAINVFNEALGVDDTRVTDMGDFGFAQPRNSAWPKA